MAESDDEDKKIKKKKSKEESEKKLLKKIMVGKFKLYLIIALILILVIAIIACAWFNWRVGQTRNSNDPNSPDYLPFGPYAYFSKIYVTDNGTLMPGMSVSDMWKNDKRYSRYLSDEDALAYLLNAQVVTQYPYIESANEGELNGTVKFYRNDSNDAMKYVSTDTLNDYVNKFNNNGDKDAKDKALNSFAMDSAGTITIAYLMSDSYSLTTNDSYAANQANQSIGASISNSGGNYSVSSKRTYLQTTSISYYSYIQKYVLPFNLLWSMLVIGNSATGTGGSENFVHTIASMAYAGEIKLAIDDNSNTTKYYKKYNYNEEQKYEGNLSLTISHRIEQQASETTPPTIPMKPVVSANSKTYTNDNFSQKGSTSKYQVDYKESHTKSNPTIVIRKLESWIATFNNDAEYESNTTSNKSNPSNTKENNTEWKDNGKVNANSLSGVTKWEASNVGAYMRENAITDMSVLNSTRNYDVHLYKRYADINVSSYTVVTNKGYQNGTVTSPSFNVDMARMFNVYAFNTLRKYLGISSYRRFIRALENNEDTANMVDIIKYIFNKVYNTDSYGSNLNFASIFGSATGGNGFSDTTQITGNSIEEKVWSAVKSAGYSDICAASVLGNMYGESRMKPSTENSIGAIGLIQWLDRRENLIAYANSKGTTWQDVDTQIEFLLAEMSPSGGANGCAKCQFMDKRSKHPSAYRDGWLNAKSVEEATNAFCYSFERPNDSEAKASMKDRVDYAQKCYDMYAGKTSFGSGSEGSSDAGNAIVELAKTKLGCAYEWGQRGPNSFDCSGFVYWAYKQKGIDVPMTTEGYRGSTTKEIAWDRIQPGDILIVHPEERGKGTGHAGIYLGGSDYIHAESSKTGVVISHDAKTHFKHVFRYIN